MSDRPSLWLSSQGRMRLLAPPPTDRSSSIPTRILAMLSSVEAESNLQLDDDLLRLIAELRRCGLLSDKS